MATLTFAHTDPSSGSKADECLSFTVGLPDYHVLYEDILGYGTDDKVCGTLSGQTVNAVIRINETDYSTTCTVTEAWKALYNYKGVQKVVIDENTITGDAPPLLMYEEQQPKVAGSN